MSQPSVPPGWRDIQKGVVRPSFGAHELDYRRVSKPYKVLLSWDEGDVYLFQCGFPETDKDPMSCYVLLNPTASDVQRIVWPQNLADIFKALEFLQTETEEQHLKWELAEARPMEEISEDERDDLYQEWADKINSTLSRPVVPPGWRDVQDRLMRQAFGAHDLLYRRVSKPYKVLLSWTQDDIHLFQCGFPETDKDPMSCYVLYNGSSGDVQRIIWPRNLADICKALEFLQTETEEQHLKWELAEARPMEEISEDERDDLYQEWADKINSSLFQPVVPPGWTDVQNGVRRQIFGAHELHYRRVSKPYKALLSWDEGDVYLFQCGFPESEDPMSCYVLLNPTASDVQRIVWPRILADIYKALEFLQTETEQEHLELELAEARPMEEIPEEFRDPSYQEWADKINSTLSQPVVPPGWTDVQNEVWHAFGARELARYRVSKPYKVLLLWDRSDIYLFQCGFPESEDPLSCYVLYDVMASEVMRIVWPRNLADVYRALKFLRTNNEQDRLKWELAEERPKGEISR